jgi:glutamate-5-semialdehyde dehydrogenase
MSGIAPSQLPTRVKLAAARRAAALLAQLSAAERNDLLLGIACALEQHEAGILRANEEDLDRARLAGSMRDRLLLNPERISEMVKSVRDVAALPDPVGEVIEQWTRPNGLLIRQIRVPFGVIGIVYESRPNVTADATVLALKTGNAAVLRGGKEAACTNRALVDFMSAAPGIPEGAVQLLDSATRDSVQELIRARGLVDVVIPRGGAALISHVMENSLVPVIETGAGNCHIYVDESADLVMASRIVLNAKTQRPSVCNAAEKLLVHQSVAEVFVPRIVNQLIAAGVEVRGDDAACRLASGVSRRTGTKSTFGFALPSPSFPLLMRPSSTSIATPPAILSQSSLRTRRTRASSFAWWIRLPFIGMLPPASPMAPSLDSELKWASALRSCTAGDRSL